MSKTHFVSYGAPNISGLKESAKSDITSTHLSIAPLKVRLNMIIAEATMSLYLRLVASVYLNLFPE